MKSISTVSILASLTGWASAKSQFHSRPDLSPPRLNITIPAAEDVAPGLIFVTPYPGRGSNGGLPEQPAAYIFRGNGDLVWSSLGYLSGFVANLQATTYQGKPALQAFQGTIDTNHGRGYGTLQILSEEYRPIAQIQSLTNKIPSIHELRIVGEKTALVEIYDPVPYDLTPYGGTKEQAWIIDSILQEIDIETGELIFEVHSLDIVSPADSQAPIFPSTGLGAADGWDYFHLNSIDKDGEGNYLISSRHTSTIYKLSGLDGSIIWQLGGDRSTFESSPAELKFGHQHDARFLDRSADGQIETISFFDNSAWQFDTPGHDRRTSRGIIVQLNHADNSTKILQSYVSPDGLVAESQGNAQVLPNGNVFVNWGQEGAVTEFRADGTPIFNAYLDTGGASSSSSLSSSSSSSPSSSSVQSYRGFRFEWTGRPKEVPAVVALRDKGEVSVYASWNGDTQVALWRFYVQDGDDADATTVRGIGAVERSSFETRLSFSSQEIEHLGDAARIFAGGFAADGTALTRSRAVAVREVVHVVANQEGDDRADL